MNNKTIYKPNRGIIELCMTYRCNVTCDNCSNLCTQAPYSGDLTPADVLYFTENLQENGQKVGQITMHGGEPVLNPYIDEIVSILSSYRKETGCILWLLTNNSSDSVRKKVTKISVKYDIALGVSTKIKKNINGTGSPIRYVQVNNSPCDNGRESDHGCYQTSTCGICFNYLGFFPCSPMAAAARVFGYKGIHSIVNFTDDQCDLYFKEHCKHCGFSDPNEPHVVDQVTSKTWEDALRRYNVKNCNN